MTAHIATMPPCPPHDWSHAPTVGYFRCDKCQKRVEHTDPDYDRLLWVIEGQTRAASAGTHPKDGDALAAPLGSGAVPHEDAADAQVSGPILPNKER